MKPEPTLYDVAPVTVESMRTRDSVRLDADVYRPVADEALPVLLMRQPYGRCIASTVTYAHPRWYAARGYVVVVQDVRGRGSSEGEFDLFVNERADGADTLDWAANLDGANGRVGMYGFSYQGMTQLFAAANRHPALQAICPAMAGFDTRADMAWEGGAFCAVRNICWAAQLGAESARRAGDDERYRALYALGHEPGVDHLIDPGHRELRKLLAGTHYDSWLDQPAGSDYWRARSPADQLDGRLDVPALFVGGWFDGFLPGTLAAWRDLGGHAPRRLMVGPWGHLPWLRHVGELDLGPQAESSHIDRAQIRWFDRFLKDTDTDAESPVSLFDVDARVWRDYPEWPSATPHRWYTATDTRRRDGGALTASAGGARSTFVHDPWRPVADTGSHAGKTPGPRRRDVLDAQPDVVCFQSAAFETPHELAGDVRASLDARADTPSFDLVAVLSLVDAEGVARNICQGARRVARGEAGPVEVSLRAICTRVPAGGALRLSVSGAAFPAYNVNSGQGGAIGAAALSTITIELIDGPDSYLELPVTAAAA